MVIYPGNLHNISRIAKKLWGCFRRLLIQRGRSWRLCCLVIVVDGWWSWLNSSIREDLFLPFFFLLFFTDFRFFKLFLFIFYRRPLLFCRNLIVGIFIVCQFFNFFLLIFLNFLFLDFYCLNYLWFTLRLLTLLFVFSFLLLLLYLFCFFHSFVRHALFAWSCFIIVFFATWSLL